jgi:hypothetical protein
MAIVIAAFLSSLIGCVLTNLIRYATTLLVHPSPVGWSPECLSGAVACSAGRLLMLLIRYGIASAG